MSNVFEELTGWSLGESFVFTIDYGFDLVIFLKNLLHVLFDLFVLLLEDSEVPLKFLKAVFVSGNLRFLANI